MAFTRTTPAVDCADVAGLFPDPTLGPSPVYAGLTDDDLRADAAELLGEWFAADKHYGDVRPWLLRGALYCLSEIDARALWPDRVAALDDAAEAHLERGPAR